MYECKTEFQYDTHSEIYAIEQNVGRAFYNYILHVVSILIKLFSLIERFFYTKYISARFFILVTREKTMNTFAFLRDMFKFT